MKLLLLAKAYNKAIPTTFLVGMACVVLIINGCGLFEDQPEQIAEMPEKQAVVWKVRKNRLSEPVFIMANAYPNALSYLSHSRLFNNVILKVDSFLTPFDQPRNRVDQQIALTTQMQGGVTLDSLLSASAIETLKKQLDQVRGVSYNRLKAAPPLAVAEIVIPALRKASGNPTYARKAWELREKAYKPAVGALSQDVIKSCYRQVPLKDQARALENVLANQKAIKKGLYDMANAYRIPNYNELLKAREKAYPYPPVFDSTCQKKVKTGWLKAIRKYEGSNPILAVVGARYLQGRKGLLNQLRKSGFEVKPYNPKRFPNAEKQNTPAD